ncbi:AAA family ATPase [Streptomyces roseoverticillatus]|uniref:AAA family ATPase n=1 Tax=Streptomyces roseoverticillatus TaxID=66429 RepID=UPI0004C0B71F|nr:ATP-binding protein [Streptomyces roseoverticillatus]
MLLSFRVSNHRSIREEQQLLLARVGDAGDSEEGRDAGGEPVPIAVLFGANAAGKSNVVDALHFMADLVRTSHRDAEPGAGLVRSPFLLDQESADAASWYVVDLVLDGVRHTYGFGLDDERIRDEWLYRYPGGERQTVFQRSGDDIRFGDAAPRPELDLVRSITEPNALFLTVAARSRQAGVQPVYAWFMNVRFRAGGAHGSPDPGSLLRLQDPQRAASVVALLRAADLGIEDMGIEDFDAAEAGDRLSVRGFADRLVRELRRTELSTCLFTTTTARVWIRQKGRGGSSARLGLEDQSQGTRMLFDYAGPVLDTLEQGGVLIVDEVDSSLHPRITAHLIRLFQEPATNPHAAQLLLTTHDVSLLGRCGGEEILRRDQIWFVEKDRHGESALYPLSDFEPRDGENRERRYLGGSYGAVPVLSDERFEAALAARGRAAADGEDAEE